MVHTHNVTLLFREQGIHIQSLMVLVILSQCPPVGTIHCLSKKEEEDDDDEEEEDEAEESHVALHPNQQNMA
jgi:hypothetical protein